MHWCFGGYGQTEGTWGLSVPTTGLFYDEDIGYGDDTSGCSSPSDYHSYDLSTAIYLEFGGEGGPNSYWNGIGNTTTANGLYCSEDLRIDQLGDVDGSLK